MVIYTEHQWYIEQGNPKTIQYADLGFVKRQAGLVLLGRQPTTDD
jgi:hypothetical protein